MLLKIGSTSSSPQPSAGSRLTCLIKEEDEDTHLAAEDTSVGKPAFHPADLDTVLACERDGKEVEGWVAPRDQREVLQ